MGLATLGGTALWDSAWSGFNYPPTVRSIFLLGDDSGAGFETLQRGALPLRRGRLTFYGTSTVKDAVRGYYESTAAQTFVDHLGTSTSVRVIEFTSEIVAGEAWRCTTTLVEAAA